MDFSKWMKISKLGSPKELGTFANYLKMGLFQNYFPKEWLFGQQLFVAAIYLSYISWIMDQFHHKFITIVGGSLKTSYYVIFCHIISILRLLDLICMNKYLVRLIMNIGSAQRYLNIWVSTYKQRFYLLRKLSNILMQVSAPLGELFPFKKFLLCMIFRSFHLQLSSFSLKIQNWLCMGLDLA